LLGTEYAMTSISTYSFSAKPHLHGSGYRDRSQADSQNQRTDKSAPVPA
jgi:hypothetical protein